MDYNWNSLLCKVKLVLTGVLIVFTLTAIGQNGTPEFLKQTDWLDAGDLRKWGKYLDQLGDADNLLIQSNDSYLKVGTLEADASIEESKKEKQIYKFEKEAAEIYKQALIKYKEAYGQLYNILENKIDEPLKVYPAYTEMQYFSQQAEELYDASGKAQTDVEIEKLSQANEMQLASLEKGISIFTVTPSEQNNAPTSASETSAESEEIVFDNELYQKYKAYISDNSIADPVVITQLMQLEGDEAAFEEFEKKWRQYLSNEEVTLAQKEELAELLLDSLVAEQKNLVSSETLEEQELPGGALSSSGGTETKSNTTIIENTFTEERTASEANLNSGIPTFLESTNVILGDEFRVQIAASKVQLTISQVAAIYTGELSLMEFKEGSYYKYQIRGFRLFTDAQSVCSNSGVTSAYLAAYNKTGSVSLAEAVKENRNLENEVKKYGRQRILKSIDFSVQIAASRGRISQVQIGSIYSGSQPVSTIFEEGWYKYQILAGSELQNAFNILENCGVKKAFLVAYKNGRKLNLYKAINEYKTYQK